MPHNCANWDVVDWSLPDVLIAKQQNVSRQRVYQKRRELNGPKPQSLLSVRARARQTMAVTMAKKGKTGQAIAKRLGVTPATVSNYLKGGGMAPGRGARDKYAWHTVNWATMNNKDIARKLGCSVQTAAGRRHLRGKPYSPYARSRGKVKHELAVQ